MATLCPGCSARLAPFAVSCEHCSWSLSQTENSAGEPAVSVDQSPPTSGGTGVTAQTHLDQAMLLIDQERWENAIDSINRAIVVASANQLGECFSLRGYCHLKIDDFGRSEKDCSEALRLNWSDSQTYAWRAAARGEQNQWRLAFEDLDRAWSVAGDDGDQFSELMNSYVGACESWFAQQGRVPSALTEMGCVYFCCGKYEHAELCLREALQKSPNDPMASAALARLITENKSSTGKYSKKQAGEVLKLCDAAIGGDAHCQKIALPLRSRILREKGDLGAAVEDLAQLGELASGDSELAVQCCRLRFDAGDYMAVIDELTRMLRQEPAPVEALLLRGDCYRRIRNFGLARNDYSKFIEARPESAQGYSRRGDISVSLGNLGDAKIDIDKAIELEENCFDGWICRSRIAIEQGKLDEAMSTCRNALAIDNGKSAVFQTLASVYGKLGQYSESIEEYSRAIELAENRHEKGSLLYLRGIAFYEIGKYQDAYTDFKKACHFRPSHAGSWTWRSAACARLEKWTDAINGLQRAIDIRPESQDDYRELGRPVAKKAIAFFDRQQQRGQTNADLYRRRAIAFQFLGKFREAVEDYSNALQLEPRDSDALVRRGQTFIALEQREAAREDFQAATRCDKENDRAWYHLSQSRFRGGEIEQAGQDIRRAMGLSKRNAKYYALFADVLQAMGNGDGVVQALDRAALLDPTDPSIYRKRGLLHYQNRSYRDAIGDMSRSLELNPSQPDVLLVRGQAHARSDHPEQAIEDFEMVLTLNPNYAKAWSGRAAAMASKGQYEAALIWLTKAFHRFKMPRELCELVFARGKIFCQMGRPGPAIDDFTTVGKLMKDTPSVFAAARYARALARFEIGQQDKAVRDFKRVLRADPGHLESNQAIAWIEGGCQGECPPFLVEARPVVRPTRPPVVREKVQLATRARDWAAERPYSQWILRTQAGKEYGPLAREVLNEWIQQGRVDFGMKLLRADWSGWKRAEKIFAELSVGPKLVASSGAEVAMTPEIIE